MNKSLFKQHMKIKENLNIYHQTSENIIALSLICGGLGLLSLYFFKNPEWLILSMVGISIAWQTAQAMLSFFSFKEPIVSMMMLKQFI